MHKCTIATVIVHICTVIVVLAVIMLLFFFSLVSSCQPFFSFFFISFVSASFSFSLLRLASTLTVLVISAVGFVVTHVSMALKQWGDGVLGLNNFNGSWMGQFADRGGWWWVLTTPILSLSRFVNFRFLYFFPIASSSLIWWCQESRWRDRWIKAKILRFVTVIHGGLWWWRWRWEDLRKFCLICLKFELFGLWENLGCCLDVLWLFYYEMEDCNYYLVDEKVRERWIGFVRERGGEGENNKKL